MKTRILVRLASSLPALAAAFAAAAADTPPAQADRLFEFLKSGRYKTWSRESAPHPSAGPHPSAVLTFVNPALEVSLESGAREHPQGAAAVKELYDAKGQLSGWAVSIKTDAKSQVGKGWYWYEVLSATDPGRTVASAKGVPLCFGCHAPGTDFVLSLYPLR